MKWKRLTFTAVVLVLLSGLILGGIYYGTMLSDQLAPEYTKPAKMIEKWDGPGAAPVEMES